MKNGRRSVSCGGISLGCTFLTTKQTTTCLKETLATEEEEIVESEQGASIEDQYQFASLLVVR